MRIQKIGGGVPLSSLCPKVQRPSQVTGSFTDLAVARTQCVVGNDARIWNLTSIRAIICRAISDVLKPLRNDATLKVEAEVNASGRLPPSNGTQLQKQHPDALVDLLLFLDLRPPPLNPKL